MLNPPLHQIEPIECLFRSIMYAFEIFVQLILVEVDTRFRVRAVNYGQRDLRNRTETLISSRGKQNPKSTDSIALDKVLVARWQLDLVAAHPFARFTLHLPPLLPIFSVDRKSVR